MVKKDQNKTKQQQQQQKQKQKKQMVKENNDPNKYPWFSIKNYAWRRNSFVVRLKIFVNVFKVTF